MKYFKLPDLGEGLQEAEIVEGLEGEAVALRESTATMSKARSTSLMDYAESYREAFRAVA